jgi:uncharacterized protein YecE (DUF72 family)
VEKIWIGTSGWVYKSWANTFYPEKWPKSDSLEYYITQFPTVEINTTFYRLPSLSMVRGWDKKAPKGFLYAVKGSRFITHQKKLANLGHGVRKYFSRIKPLAKHTGPVLWQLPPNLGKDVARLDKFLTKLPKGYDYAVEFRHPSWMDREILDLLRKHNVCCVWLSSMRMPMDFTITGDFVYLRFHGLEHGAAHDYTKDELTPWAEQLRAAAQKGKPCFVYFNNDWNTRAPLNARMLMDMVGDAAVEPFARHFDSKPRFEIPAKKLPGKRRQLVPA